MFLFSERGFIAGHYFLCCNPKIGSGQYKNLDKDKTNGTTFLPPIFLKAYASIHFILVKERERDRERERKRKNYNENMQCLSACVRFLYVRALKAVLVQTWDWLCSARGIEFLLPRLHNQTYWKALVMIGNSKYWSNCSQSITVNELVHSFRECPILNQTSYNWSSLHHDNVVSL